MHDDQMDARAIAKYAGVHRQTVYRWINSERFGPVVTLSTIRSRGRMGKQVVIPRAIVEAVVSPAPERQTPSPVETASVVEAVSAV